MKKRLNLLIAIILSIGLVSYLLINKTKNYDYLYDTAIEYLKNNNDDKYYVNEDDYQLFISYKPFGTDEDENYKYAYMWILEESYYVNDGKLYSGSGSAMPYKFTFKGDKVIKYDIPKDGSEYAPSIKEIFPKNISSKILNYEYYKYLNPQNEKKKQEHYSYLSSNERDYNKSQ